jgi:hypothetical protein
MVARELKENPVYSPCAFVLALQTNPVTSVAAPVPETLRVPPPIGKRLM